jgi:hypothetical protein
VNHVGREGPVQPNVTGYKRSGIAGSANDEIDVIEDSKIDFLALHIGNAKSLCVEFINYHVISTGISRAAPEAG